MNINNVYVNYIDYGNKDGKTLVFLHGWGQNIAMMKTLADNFSSENRIVILDLPGHGESSEPTYVWKLNDFVNMIKIFFEKMEIHNPILIGHSFGGKISLLYASNFEVERLIVFGSPFRKEIKKLSLKTKILKSLKNMPVLNKFTEFAKKHIGSADYKNATPMMRDILVEHVNTDITDDVKKINASTLIIWGSNDYVVSLNEAYELEKLIKDAAVIVFPRCTHYAYLENIGQTINIINSFIKE